MVKANNLPHSYPKIGVSKLHNAALPHLLWWKKAKIYRFFKKQSEWNTLYWRQSGQADGRTDRRTARRPERQMDGQTPVKSQMQAIRNASYSDLISIVESVWGKKENFLRSYSYIIKNSESLWSFHPWKSASIDQQLAAFSNRPSHSASIVSSMVGGAVQSERKIRLQSISSFHCSLSQIRLFFLVRQCHRWQDSHSDKIRPFPDVALT